MEVESYWMKISIEKKESLLAGLEKSSLIETLGQVKICNMHIYVKTLLTSDEWPLLIKVTKLKSSKIYQRMKNRKVACGLKHKMKSYATQTFSCYVCIVMSRTFTLALNAKKYITDELEKRNLAAADCQSLIFRGCGKTICFIELSIMIISIKMMISCQLLKPFGRIWMWKFFQGVYYIA